MSRADDRLHIANVSRRGLLKGLAGASALLLAARWDTALASEQAQFGAGAMQGRKALKIDWDKGPAGDNAAYTSDMYRKSLEKAAQSPGKVVRENGGDVEAALNAADKRVSATYYMPHMAQAPMEPLVATVPIRDGKAEAWAPVQNPGATRDAIANRPGIDRSAVTVHVTLLGGGFGRKSKPDFVTEAAIVADAFRGRPVKLQ